MAAYIVGMIAGAACMIAPLIYLGHLTDATATVLTTKPEVLDQFLGLAPTGLIYAIVIIGAVVFLLSACMAAYTGYVRNRSQRPEPEKAAEPEPDGGGIHESTPL